MRWLLLAFTLTCLGITGYLGRWLILAPQAASSLLATPPPRPVTVWGIPFAELINQVSLRQGLDPALVAAVVAVESNFDPEATSPRGARGLMQLVPAAWEESAPVNCRAFECVLQPEANLEAGTRYLRRMLDRFGDVRLALSAYNAGPASVVRHRGSPPYAETQRYVTRVGLAWWELRRRGTLTALSRARLRWLDALPQLVAGLAACACACGTLLVARAGRRSSITDPESV